MALESSGSATGTTRNKTALKPGHSLMDWVRLCNSGKDMTGTGGRILTVTLEELSKHNTSDDAWIAIRGVVYNVTEYMSFHPGGEEDLLKGVGKDATRLFDEVHAWVNYSTLLKACVVGRLAKSSLLLPPISNVKISQSSSGRNNPKKKDIPPKVPDFKEDVKHDDIAVRMDWYQQLTTVVIVLYFKTLEKSPEIYTSLPSNKQVIIYLNGHTNIYNLEDEVRWPCKLKLKSNILEMSFEKIKSVHWSNIGSDLKYVIPIKYHNMKLIHTSWLTHDTKLIALQYVDKTVHYIHIGYHVFIRYSNKGIKTEKPYTPIRLLFDVKIFFDKPTLFFIIKSYGKEKFSGILCSLKVNDIVEITNPRGSFFPVSLLKDANILLLFAAGTGITPMISIIAWAQKIQRLKVSLILFNKTEKDILWKKEFDTLSNDNNGFNIRHILSQASDDWKGERGFITEEIVSSIFSELTETSFTFICGPNEFTNLCKRYIEESGCPEAKIHCF